MSSFGLLDKKDEADVEVQWGDQQRINQFSKCNARLELLEEEYAKQQTEKEYLDDLSMEIELLDEDEPVRFKVGTTFMLIPLEDARWRVEKQKEEIDHKVDELRDRIEATEKEMAELKTILYNKFGKAINLEKD
ncbi:hypothetical protein EV182_004509 [Spiromyces aspiralis]|uniref:Uncharacterized protein n=1 Tax=Spiromyces aspiralis TaxID=68401 RepID=A0ACC1HEQ0_9FUNG|nr:hypothetical protein EV182_004509 [Spiromyces aspiralis]